MTVWRVPCKYEVGVHVTWEGVRLVCTRAHYAGDAAVHPWDPGDGWSAAKAATLWAPNGEVEAARLRVVVQQRPAPLSGASDRLGAVLREVMR